MGQSMVSCKYKKKLLKINNTDYFLIYIKKDTEKIDLHVIPTWAMGYTGKGIVVSVLDDGKYFIF